MGTSRPYRACWSAQREYDILHCAGPHSRPCRQLQTNLTIKENRVCRPISQGQEALETTDKHWTGLPRWKRVCPAWWNRLSFAAFSDNNTQDWTLLMQRLLTSTVVSKICSMAAEMELCCPWGMFQSHSNACQCSLLLPWNICKRGAIEQKKTV